jgi:hypothetical protein
MVEIKLNQDGFAILDVSIKPVHSSAMEMVRFKADTGANRTTISFNQLQKLGYGEAWVKSGKPIRPTVASGLPVDDCYEVILPEIRIGEWVGYNWPVLTSLSAPFKFLLGTDSMQFFNWVFNYEKGVCSFDFIQDKRKLLFNKTEQSIHSIDGANFICDTKTIHN